MTIVITIKYIGLVLDIKLLKEIDAFANHSIFIFELTEQCQNSKWRSVNVL